MGKSKRIPVDDIQTMKKTLDALPDKHIGKTREQAADMLLANIQKAIAKGYTAKELAAIMGKGNVPISAPLLRAKVLPKAEKREKPTKPPKLSKPEAPLAPEKANPPVVLKEPEQAQVQTPPLQSPAVARAQAILGASAPRPAQGGGFKIRPDTPKDEL